MMSRAGELPVEQAVALEELCDRFENAWQGGARPDIAAVVAGLAEPLRSVALQELIALDVFYRRQAGETPAARDYADRFPSIDVKILLHASGERSLLATRSEAERAEARTQDPDGGVHPSSSLTGSTANELLGGRYRLVKPLGEGGMGTVWQAEQLQPVRRLVALKLIKAGMDSQRVLARFEAERQALAVMDHPHIARVFDAGTTGDGRPYFVMELVAGVPLTAYCDNKRLSIDERLALVAQVCQAVQHAHTKGVVHRDLKPSNILVAEVDGKPVPKVIDFGLAKALQTGVLPEVSLESLPGSLLGTPLYMAPEQAEAGTLDIDTRADVYALGVILYELLTGSTPIDRDTARKAALAEVLRLIREEEPPTPLRRLESSAGLPALAAVRGVEPGRLRRQVRGDLEWITLRCLEKDRSRRYETADALAADVRRYLADEPVSAGPPSRWYRLGKLVRRHRGAVLAASLLLLALLGGIGGTTWGLVQARSAERRAEQEAERARTEAEMAQAVNGFLQKLLAQANPFDQPDPDLKLRTVLDRASREVEGRFAEQPLVEAAVRYTLGRAYSDLAQHQTAVRHLRRAHELRMAELGEDHPDTLTAANRLGFDLAATSRYEEGEQWMLRTLVGRRKVLGEEHPQTLETMNDLGVAYRFWAKYDQAEKWYLQALAARRRVLGKEHLDTLETVQNLSVLYRYMRKDEAAGRLADEAWAGYERQFGPNHLRTLAALRTRSQLHLQSRQFAQAESLTQKVLDGFRRVLGEENGQTCLVMQDMAYVHSMQGRIDQAITWQRKALEIELRVNGEATEAASTMSINLADFYRRQGKWQEMEPLIRRTVAWHRRHRSANDLQRLRWIHVLGTNLHIQKKYVEAEALYREALEGRRRALGTSHEEVGNTLVPLGRLLLELRRYSEAESAFREVLSLRQARQPHSWQTASAQSLVGAALLAQKRHAEAEPLLLEGYRGLKANEKAIPPGGATWLPDAAGRLVELYTALGKKDEAAQWQTERSRYAATKNPSGSPGP